MPLYKRNVDDLAHVASLLNHMRTQVNTLGDLLNPWFGSCGSWWKKIGTHFGNYFVICVFYCMCLFVAVVFAPNAARQLPNEQPACK